MNRRVRGGTVGRLPSTRRLHPFPTEDGGRRRRRDLRLLLRGESEEAPHSSADHVVVGSRLLFLPGKGQGGRGGGTAYCRRRYHLRRICIAPAPPTLPLSPLATCLPPPLGPLFKRNVSRNRFYPPPAPPSLFKMEDEEWLEKHPRYGLAAAATDNPSEKKKERLLDDDKLELMLGILEMATGQADPVPLPQAETLFVSKLGMSKVSRPANRSLIQVDRSIRPSESLGVLISSGVGVSAKIDCIRVYF